MTTIHRTEVKLGVEFTAPERVTFGYQEERKTFSVWYVNTDTSSVRYIALGTGWDSQPDLEIVSSFIMPDGFEVYHLCRIK